MGTVESCAPSKKGQEKASATSALTSLPFYFGISSLQLGSLVAACPQQTRRKRRCAKSTPQGAQEEHCSAWGGHPQHEGLKGL